MARVLALALTSCESSGSGGKYSKSDSEDAAAMTLMGGTAFMNGWNSGRASHPMVMCTSSYGLTTCY